MTGVGEAIRKYAKPPSVRGRFRLHLDKNTGELWSGVPSGEARRKRLRGLVESLAEPKNPVSLLEYYDCLGYPEALEDSSQIYNHQLCVVCGGRNGSGVWSEYLEVLTRVAKAMEDEFGRVWAIKMHDHSDVHYLTFGFRDGTRFRDMWEAAPKEDRFLCDCGQYGGVEEFLKRCPFAGCPGGCGVKRGFSFNDSSDKGGCRDWVSDGETLFMNHGFLGNSMADGSNGETYSWLARARNIDEGKCRYVPFEYGKAPGSVDEFALRMEAADGLRPGDHFCMGSGCYPCWDGEKWIDFYAEKVIREGR